MFDSKKYLVAFLITAAIFGTAFYIANRLDAQRLADIRTAQEAVSIDILSLETQFELLGSLDRAKDELFRLKLGRFTNQLTNVMQIRQKRREISRIQTVISARRKGLEKAGAGAKE